jgi:hypothetical protein
MDTQTPTIRQLMPSGFLTELRKRTNRRTSTAYLSTIVQCETVGSKFWPHVAALAEETNPEGYAAWKAAHGPIAASKKQPASV